MPTGENLSGTLAEGLQDIIADARIDNEFEGVWSRVTTKERQAEGTGLNWTKVNIAKLEAQDITETTNNHNYQQFEADEISVEPQMTQIITKVTDRFYRKQAKVVSSKVGKLAGNAMARKKDKDYLAMYSVLNAATSPGAGNPLSFGHILAAKNRIRSNSNEPSMVEINTILRGEQVYDIQSEVLAGVGTYTIPDGMTEDVFKKGFEGTVGGTNLWTDDNIAILTGDDARGACHSKDSIIAVLSMSLKHEMDRDIYFGGGADVISLVDEYGFVEQSPGNWGYQLVSDATAPTS